jgi:two-component system nitrogen regulation response regulator GlnG
MNVEAKVLRADTAEFLSSLDWPGNVRQLENTCRWLTVMASGREILVDDLPPELRRTEGAATDGADWEQALRHWADRELARGARAILDQAVPAFERIMIETALRHTAGRRRDASLLLGWGRNTLTRKIKELGIADD